MEQSLTAREFYYWVAYDRLNPIGDERNDIHSAQIASAVYQSQGAQFSLKDCILDFRSTSENENDEPMDIGEAMFNLLSRHNDGNS